MCFFKLRVIEELMEVYLAHWNEDWWNLSLLRTNVRKPFERRRVNFVTPSSLSSPLEKCIIWTNIQLRERENASSTILPRKVWVSSITSLKWGKYCSVPSYFIKKERREYIGKDFNPLNVEVYLKMEMQTMAQILLIEGGKTNSYPKCLQSKLVSSKIGGRSTFLCRDKDHMASNARKAWHSFV